MATETVTRCRVLPAYWHTARYKTWSNLRPFIEDEAIGVDTREPVALTIATVSPSLPSGGKSVDVEGCLGMTPLYCSISSGHEGGFTTLLFLLDNGADVNAQGYVASFRGGARYWDSVLAAAVQSGSEEVVKYLLQRGADPRQLRCCAGKILSAEEVVPQGISTRSALLSLLKTEPFSDLFVGARTGDLTEVQRALNRNRASVDIKDLGGNTALMRAAQYGQQQVVEYLLKRKAKVDEANAFGYTALWFAAYYGHERIVRLLMEQGADPTVARIAYRVEKKKMLQRQKDAMLSLLNEDVIGTSRQTMSTVLWAGYVWLAVVTALAVLFFSERATFHMLSGSDSDHIRRLSPRQIDTCIKRWCRSVPTERELIQRSAADLKELCRACQREWTPVPNMTLAFSDVVVRGDDITILEKASGELTPGMLTAIMGSSGDGKSTLINAIRGSISGYRDVQGVVTFDNRQMNVKTAGSVLRPLTGFVPQSDVFYDYLTVEENLLSQLYWRSSPRRHASEKAQKLKLVLEDLGIAHIRHKRCRGRVCSGGQKKRVSIAMELVGDPSILFLDEPTSGLDYVTSYNLVSMLKNLTKERKVHVSVIVHQPAKRIFDMFDQLFLVKKGHIVYSGAAGEALPLYRSFGYDYDDDRDLNPSEWLVEVLHGHLKNDKHGGEVVDEDQVIFDWLNHQRRQTFGGTNETLDGDTCFMPAFNETLPTCRQSVRPEHSSSDAGKNNQPARSTTSPASSAASLLSYLSPWALWDALKLRGDELRIYMSGEWAKFGAVYYRECLVHFRRGGGYIFTVPLLVGGLAGVLRALIGRQCEELEGGNFMLSIGSTLVFMVHSVSIFGLDGAMRKREMEAGMNPAVYFLAKSVFALIPALLLPLVLLISYIMAAGVVLSMQDKHSAQQWWALRLFHLHTYCLLVLCCLTCQSLGFSISFVLPDISLAYLVVVGCVLFFHVNGSFTPRLSQWAQLPFSWPQLFVHTSYVTFFLALQLITQPPMDDWKDPSGYVSFYTRRRSVMEAFGYSGMKYRRYLFGGLIGGACAWRLAALVIFMMTQSP